jgi:hypothetical protein
LALGHAGIVALHGAAVARSGEAESADPVRRKNAELIAKSLHTGTHAGYARRSSAAAMQRNQDRTVVAGLRIVGLDAIGHDVARPNIG